MLELSDLYKGIDCLAKNCETKYSLVTKNMTINEKLDLIQVCFYNKIIKIRAKPFNSMPKNTVFIFFVISKMNEKDFSLI